MCNMDSFLTASSRYLKVYVKSADNDNTTTIMFIRLSNKGNNKITELRKILQRESQNS
jgi:hypothetical protein